jgi:hypothetical protein
MKTIIGVLKIFRTLFFIFIALMVIGQGYRLISHEETPAEAQARIVKGPIKSSSLFKLFSGQGDN